MPDRWRFARAIVAVLTLAAVAGLLLAPLHESWLGPWQGKIFDFGHVPLFAVVVVVLRATIAPLWLSLLIAVVVAGAAEVVQPHVGRTRDGIDFLRGVLGALAGAAAVRAWQHRRSWRLAGYVTLGVALSAWPIVEVMPYLRDTMAGRKAFPVLADFSTEEQMLRWETRQASIVRDGEGARLDLRPGPELFSWAALRPMQGDFRGYRWLHCEFRVVGGSVDLVTSIRAATYDGKRTTHAQVGHRYPEGEYRMRFDLESLKAHGYDEPFNLGEVRWLQFFVMKLPEPRTVILRKVWLERD